MGNQVSYSKTANFFINNFDTNDSFYLNIDDFSFLFSYKDEDVFEDHFIVRGEVLTRTHRSSIVTIRSPENSSYKTDVNNYEPSIVLKIYFQKEGFHNKNYIDKDPILKKIIQKLEKSILSFHTGRSV